MNAADSLDLERDTNSIVDLMEALYEANDPADPRVVASSLKRIRDRADDLLTALKDDHGEDVVPA